MTMSNILMVHSPLKYPAEPLIRRGLTPQEALRAVRYKHGKTEVFADGICIGWRYPCAHQDKPHGARCPVTLRYRCRWHTYISERLHNLVKHGVEDPMQEEHDKLRAEFPLVAG